MVGASHSGRKHLAKMIGKKFGHKVVENSGRDIPAIRKEFYIAGPAIDASEAEKKKAKDHIEREKKNKFVIEGKFTDSDLERLFKGKSYRVRNFKHNNKFTFNFGYSH